MNAIEQKALKSLVEQWNNVMTHLEKLRLPAARPDDGYRIFSLIEHPKVAGQIGFEVAPVTFNVPERAYASPDIFIVAKGRIYLDEDALKTQKALKTVNFATEVGYFRKSKTKAELDHIYGAHYDFSFDEIGHPIFHAQMKSYNERACYVTEEFQLDCTSNDLIKHVLRTVRLPIAQMDFFALVLQICADHLMSKDSPPEEIEAFADLRKVSRAIQGAGHLCANLSAAPPCMRSVHWYS
jgi:hypothetical protein